MPAFVARRPDSPKMRVLVVLSSSNQMYSGIGRAVFELSSRMASRVDFEFAIDDLNPRNTDLVARFGREQGMPVHVGPGRREPDALDHLNAALPGLLERGRWDAVECVCFANAATNGALLESLDDRVTLAYTPHDQPTWTVPMTPSEAARLESVHRRVLARSDAVFCDSPREKELLQALVPGRNHCIHVPLGCDFRGFRAGNPQRRDQLLFVGDLAEPRKRFDRVLAVFARLIRVRPQLRLIVVGNKSDASRELIPRDLRHAVDLRGYISEEELRRTYAESAGLLLLSDFEAFGIPILEALACGTPVFLSRQEATQSLFEGFRAAHFCPADDPDATADVVARTLARGRHAVAEALADRRRLQAAFDWDVLAHRKWQALAAAWFRRNCWAVPA
jgi:glycosyltransferase involved in cell wall biosynthesis